LTSLANELADRPAGPAIFPTILSLNFSEYRMAHRALLAPVVRDQVTRQLP
jgi:hypothetical protein